ncbi:MAG: TauD/TfdA family dioxygenase [Gammaproteobacteria bacterium]|nr:TauD/TfdA family dioxygenase [Gammaproteobacteria bacterium]
MLSRRSERHADPSNSFDLSDNRSYLLWRERKLANSPQSIGQVIINVENINALNPIEVHEIKQRCQWANMAVYQCRQSESVDREAIRDLGKQFGLNHLDRNIRADDGGISALHVSTIQQAHEYIPYSNRAINWHTDGYYNELHKKIRAMILHCVSPAASGGENTFVDHEILYLLMRDENPAYITALMQPDAMTIPANIENGVELRPAQSGPVFSIDPQSGQLHMRYTARTKSIEWKADSLVQEAVEFIKVFLRSDSSFILRHRMAAGQGLICNNVLHNRSEFVDDAESDQQRLVYRGRFYERIE